MVGFTGCRHEVELVLHLLEIATSLEKLIILVCLESLLERLANLVELVQVNPSRNHLSGIIPNKVGELNRLDPWICPTMSSLEKFQWGWLNYLL